MKYVYSMIILLSLAGCTTTGVETADLEKKEEKILKNIPIYDLETIPQTVEYYTKNLNENRFYDIQSTYDTYYFSVWNDTRTMISVDDMKWPFAEYTHANSYGENLQLLPNDFFVQMLKESNFEDYATINKNAMTIKLSNIRAFPTSKPLLKDPSIAGEGFPFDYLQNSTIQANKPIYVSHYSLDKKWVYVISSFAWGWIRTDEMVFLDTKYTKRIENSEQVKIIKDNVAIYDEENHFLFYSKIGMRLSLIDETQDDYIVLAIASLKNQEPLYKKAKISKKIATLNTFILNKENLSLLIDDLSRSKYGWGGIYEQRDCSSTLRDLFAPFDIWLPRNSYKQSKIGKVISLENQSSINKINIIKENAIPFQTLLYKKGHILLYVGLYKNEIIVFHNTWGIKTLKDGVEGRIIIGKPIFSTLQLGKNQIDYDKESELLKNLTSINILTK